MRDILVPFVIFLCVLNLSCEGLKCGPNEMARCGECPPERNCQNRGIAYNCFFSPQCRKSCVCKEGFIRNNVHECVSDDICDSCKAPHEFWDCGPECDNECSTLQHQNRTNCPIVNIICNQKCYCEDGYARNSNGVCVPIKQCSAQATHSTSQSSPPVPPDCGGGGSNAGWWWFFRAGVFYVAYPDCNAEGVVMQAAVLPKTRKRNIK